MGVVGSIKELGSWKHCLFRLDQTNAGNWQSSQPFNISAHKFQYKYVILENYEIKAWEEPSKDNRAFDIEAILLNRDSKHSLLTPKSFHLNDTWEVQSCAHTSEYNSAV